MLVRLMTVFALLIVGVDCQRLRADDKTKTEVPLSQAVAEFNTKWESERKELGQPKLMAQEILAAIRQERPDDLSLDSQKLVANIAETGMFPQRAKLVLYRRHFSRGYMSYVWTIALVIDVRDESRNTPAKSFQKPKTQAERLVIRKQYLASQPSRPRDELKSLDELLVSKQP